jgi:hypothetical protein
MASSVAESGLRSNSVVGMPFKKSRIIVCDWPVMARTRGASARAFSQLITAGAIDARQPDIDDDRVITAWNASGEKALRIVEAANHMAQLFHEQAERIADGCIVFEYIDRQKPGAFAWTAPPVERCKTLSYALKYGADHRQAV